MSNYYENFYQQNPSPLPPPPKPETPPSWTETIVCSLILVAIWLLIVKSL